MKSIPEFPEITEEMKSKYNYWAIDPYGEFWVYKVFPRLGVNCWVSGTGYSCREATKVTELKGELKDWTEAVGYLHEGKPDNWDSLWVVERSE